MIMVSRAPFATATRAMRLEQPGGDADAGGLDHLEQRAAGLLQLGGREGDRAREADEDVDRAGGDECSEQGTRVGAPRILHLLDHVGEVSKPTNE